MSVLDTCINTVDRHILYPALGSGKTLVCKEYVCKSLKIQHNAVRVIFLVNTVFFFLLLSLFNGDLNPNIAGTYIYRLD